MKRDQTPDNDNDANRALGQRVRYLRREILGIVRQTDFAERLQVTRDVVVNWETGKGVKRDDLERIAEMFGISAIWLSRGSGSPVLKAECELELLPPDDYDPLYELFGRSCDDTSSST